MIKLTGIEFKQIYESDWNDVLKTPSDYDLIITLNEFHLNGEQKDDYFVEEISDADVIKIDAIIYDDHYDSDFSTSFDSLVRKWRKMQDTTSFVVTAKQDKAAELKKLIKQAGGTVSQ